MIDRRTFLVTASAAVATLALPTAGAAATMSYTPGLVAERLSAGETVFLDFTATWCSTCAAQGRVIDGLKAANPAYEANVTFVDVDWDTYRRANITKTLRIPRRSTLVVLKGNHELGRIVAGTSTSAIRQLMDIALGAATA